MTGDTSIISEANRVKLAKILGMTGSDQLGERAAAAEQANTFVRHKLGLQWSDVLAPPPPAIPQPAHDPFHEAQRAGGEVPWRDKAAMVAKSYRATPWERGFAESLANFPYLSERQEFFLNKAYSKVRKF